MKSFFNLDLDRAALNRSRDGVITAFLEEATRAVADITRALELEYEAAVRSAVKGNLYRAFKSRTDPKGGRGAYEPSGRVFLNGQGKQGKIVGRAVLKGNGRTIGAMNYFTKSGVNESESKGWLAIPTKFAGALNRQRQITPAEWQAKTGIKLNFVPGHNGKNPVLMASDISYGQNNKGARVVRRRAGKSGQPLERLKSVPIFVLIPFQRFANKVSLERIGQGADDRLRRRFIQRIDGRIGRLGRS